MTSDLVTVLHARGNRADETPDADAMLADVRARVEQRARRRRSVIGASAASATVAVVAVVAVAVGGSDATRRGGPGPSAPAGGAPAARSMTTATAAATSHPTSSPASARTHTKAVPNPPTTPGHLDTLAAAPRSAPGSLRLVPRGYQFLGAAHQGDITTYGDPRTSNHNPKDWTGKLIISPGRIPPALTQPLDTKIIGRPASIRWSPAAGWGWIVNIKYSAKIAILVQVPLSARLTRGQVQHMLDTLDVRDVSDPAVG